jgi:hypothetical protein
MLAAVAVRLNKRSEAKSIGKNIHLNSATYLGHQGIPDMYS